MNFRAITVLLSTSALVIFMAGCTNLNSKSTETPEEQAKAKAEIRYTCCNLHYNGDWINDGNYAQLPMIPAGTPIKVLDYGSHRASVEIDGKRFRLGLDYGRQAETTEQWVSKLAVKRNPKAKLARYSAKVQKSIKNGRVMKGMTKEQVIMSLGYPQTNENPRLSAPVWRYWWSNFGEYQVHWKGGVVSKITGHPETLANVVGPGGTPHEKNSSSAASKEESGKAQPSTSGGKMVKGIDGWEGEIVGKPAANSKFRALKVGMSMDQAVKRAGQPTSKGAYVTGKAWIPFYFGSDRHRFEMVYKGHGRLVFAGGSLGDYTGGNLVTIINNRSEAGSL